MSLTQVPVGMLDKSAQYTGMKNRIINGDMRIDQRYAGASVTPGDGAYLVDRWAAIAYNAASKYSAQQTTTAPAGFTNSLKITSLSSYTVATTDVTGIYQRIEGLNLSDMGFGTVNAKTFTLSFQVQSSLTGTFGGSIVNGAQNRSYPFTYSIPVANTWTSISIVIPGDTSGTWLTTNGNGLQVNFGVGVGATYSGTAGSWSGNTYYSATGATSLVGTSGALLYITGVQIEAASAASGFEYRPYGQELVLAQRYFEKVGWNMSEAPGTVSGYTGSCLLLRVQGVSAAFGGSNGFQVIKRTSPTITLYGSVLGGTETSGISIDFYTGNSLGASTANRINERQFTYISSTSDSTYGAMFRYTASSEL